MFSEEEAKEEHDLDQKALANFEAAKKADMEKRQRHNEMERKQIDREIEKKKEDKYQDHEDLLQRKRDAM